MYKIIKQQERKQLSYSLQPPKGVKRKTKLLSKTWSDKVCRKCVRIPISRSKPKFYLLWDNWEVLATSRDS